MLIYRLINMLPKYHRTFLGGVVLAVLNLCTNKSKPVMLLSQKVSIDSIGDGHELFKCNSFYGHLCDEIGTT